ncbi:MAG: NUDIX domain-containing protein [Patescibacteria group bacterium]
MKIPQSAKLVFKGTIFDVYQWEQKMYDGSHETFEMLKRPDTTQVIATYDGKIIIAEEQQPQRPSAYFTLFGGRVENGEESLAAAKRELLEEAGMASNDWELWRTDEPVGKMEWTVYTYIARNCKKVQEQNLDAGEKITVKEITFEQFVADATHPSFRSLGITLELLKLQLEPRKLALFKQQLFKKP